MGGLLTTGQLASMFFFVGLGVGIAVHKYLAPLMSRTPAPVKEAVARFEATLTAHLEAEARAVANSVLLKAGINQQAVSKVEAPVSPVVLPPVGVTGPVGPS